MDTGLQNLYTDIINLKQGQSLSMLAIQSLETNLKLEEQESELIAEEYQS